VRRGSEEMVSGRAPVTASAGSGSLGSLQGSPRKSMTQLLGRRKAIMVVPRYKQGSLTVEAVIPKASNGAQQLKGVGRGKEIRTRGCQDMQLQRGCTGGHCRVCHGLGAPRWRL